MYYILYEAQNEEPQTENIPQQDTLLILHDFILKWRIIEQFNKLKQKLEQYTTKVPELQLYIDMLDDLEPALRHLTPEELVKVYDDFINSLRNSFSANKSEAEEK